MLLRRRKPRDETEGSLGTGMAASYRRLWAAICAGAGLALLAALAATAVPAAAAATVPALGTSTLPFPPPTLPVPMLPPIGSGLLPAAGIGLPVAVARGCNRFAAPYGSDSARGGVRAPFRTVQRLVNALRPGQIGCLRAGTYIRSVRIARGGRVGAPVTLTAYPGETATIMGRLEIVEGASYVTVTGLRLNGANPRRLPSPIT